MSKPQKDHRKGLNRSWSSSFLVGPPHVVIRKIFIAKQLFWGTRRARWSFSAALCTMKATVSWNGHGVALKDKTTIFKSLRVSMSQQYHYHGENKRWLHRWRPPRYPFELFFQLLYDWNTKSVKSVFLVNSQVFPNFVVTVDYEYLLYHLYSYTQRYRDLSRSIKIPCHRKTAFSRNVPVRYYSYRNG